MKMVMAVIAVSLLSAQMSLAACQDDSMAKAARTLKLSGRVTLVDKSLDGKASGSEESDIVKRLSSKSEEYKMVKSMIDERNGEMLSGIFGLESDGSIAVVIRNKTTCDLSIFGTDGENTNTLRIVDDSIKSNSISFYNLTTKAITTITKTKKSKILSN